MKEARGAPGRATTCQVAGCARLAIVNVPGQAAAADLSLAVTGRSYVRLCGPHYEELVAEPDVPEPA